MHPFIRKNGIVSWRLLSTLLTLCLAHSGCTSLGYYPENLVARKITDSRDLVPDYKTVKTWAYDVQDGFDSRATINHYALEYGALIALAAAGTMAGLAIFSPNSDVLKGLPIGAGFLAGAAAYYDNHFRYDLYSKASDRVRELIDVTDERISRGAPRDLEARCLKYEVGKIIETVKRHISNSNPDKLVAQLSTIKGTTDKDAKLSESDQAKLLELVKASRRDLTELDPNPNLRKDNGYCKELNITAPSGYKDETTLISDDQLPYYASDLIATTATSLRVLDNELMAPGAKTVGDFTQNKSQNKYKTDTNETQRKLNDASTKVNELSQLLNRASASGWNTKFTQESDKVAAAVSAFNTNKDYEKSVTLRYNLIRQYKDLKYLTLEIDQQSDKIRRALKDAEEVIKAVPTN